MKLKHGIVVAVPNPDPMDGTMMKEAIDEALGEINHKEVTGAEITPFLLASIEKITGSASLDSNIALVLNNAKVASEIAIEICHLEKKEDREKSKELPLRPDYSTKTNMKENIVVFGGSVKDLVATSLDEVILGSSNTGTILASFGGVGRNIAEGLSQFGTTTKLLTAVCDDNDGLAILEHVQRAGVDVSNVKLLPSSISGNVAMRTASYTAVNDTSGNLVVGVGDMSIMEYINLDYINSNVGAIRKASIVVTDGNLPIDSFARIAKLCKTYNVPLFFEPTSSHKCTLPIDTDCLQLVDMMKPNISELKELMKRCIADDVIREGKAQVIAALDRLTSERDAQDLTSIRILGCALQGLMSSRPGEKSTHVASTSEGQIRPFNGKHVLISLGSQGIMHIGPLDCFSETDSVLTTTKGKIGTKVYAAPCTKNMGSTRKNSNGAGDSFCAGLLSALISDTGAFGNAISTGLGAASESLRSQSAVSANLKDSRGEDYYS
jgi:sugar/nucleoside kinase (ribokinase family)